MDANRPYMCMDGAAFQTGANDLERNQNLQAAITNLEEWCHGRGNVEDAAFALQFIQERVPKVRIYCDQIRQTFAWDSAVHASEIRAIAGPAFNLMCERMT